MKVSKRLICLLRMVYSCVCCVVWSADCCMAHRVLYKTMYKQMSNQKYVRNKPTGCGIARHAGSASCTILDNNKVDISQQLFLRAKTLFTVKQKIYAYLANQHR